MEATEQIELILSDTRERMDKSIAELGNALTQIRSGRATPGLVEDIRVEAYGQTMPMNQVGSIAIPEPRSITIDVWDKSIAQEVEKAIQKSGRNLNPQNDGGLIRINLPELNEERRRELVKLAKQKTEDYKVSIRNIRRDANDQIKKLKNEGISEDDVKNHQDTIQEYTDKAIHSMDEMLKKKETEILTV